MAVHKLDLECGFNHGPPWEVHNWEGRVCLCPREGNPVRLGFRRGEGGVPFQVPPSHPMLVLEVVRQ